MTVSTIQENVLEIYWLIEGPYVPGLVQYLVSLEHPQLEVLTVGDRGSLVAFHEYGHDAPEVAYAQLHKHHQPPHSGTGPLAVQGNAAKVYSEVLLSTDGSSYAQNRKLMGEGCSSDKTQASSEMKKADRGWAASSHQSGSSFLPTEYTSHAIIRQSTILRAWYGLMLMQQPLTRGEASQVYTDKGEHVGTYSMAPITPEEVDHLPTCNYQFCYKARGKVHHYSADNNDGSNIG